jgi:peptidoglycan/LPS O-acetylase OafA/YrhL
LLAATLPLVPRWFVAAEGSLSQVAHSSAGRLEGRYPCFDGIRAIAVLMVIVYHSVFFATWFDTRGGRFFWNLNAGVWIFFVTSGFLLYLPFAAEHLQHGPRVSRRGFAIRRLARIYPAYWAVIAFFTFVVQRATIKGVSGFFLSLSLTQTYVRARNPFLVGLPPAWSLVVEMTFYAFLPFYAAPVGWLARRWRALSVELLGVAVLGAIGVGAIVAIAEGYDAPWITVLPQHVTAFALGMLLAVVSSAPLRASTAARLEQMGRAPWIWWGLALAVFVGIPLVSRIEPLAVMSPAQAIGLNLCQTLLGFFVVIPAVLGPQHHGAVRRLLRSRTLTFLGVISYGLYLWHWFLLQVVQEDWLGWPLRHGNWVPVFLLGLPVVIAAAAASWYLLERPILGWARSVARFDRTRSDTVDGESRPAPHDK